MSKYLVICPSCECTINLEGDLPDVIQCNSCGKRLKLLKPEKKPAFTAKAKQTAGAAVEKIKSFPNEHPTTTKAFIIGSILTVVGIAAKHTPYEIINAINEFLKSKLPEDKQAEFDFWLDSCSDEELKQEYDRVNGIWMENCRNRTGSNERSHEQDRMLDELNRRYQEQYKDVPVDENRIPWKNEALFDRD